MKDLNINCFDHNFDVEQSELFRAEILAQLLILNSK